MARVRDWRVHLNNGSWRLPLEALGVECCLIDYAFTLWLYDGGERVVVVRIETHFTLTTATASFQIDPEVTAELAPALSLLHMVVRSASASENGELELTFENGAILRVAPSADYEAWQLAGPHGLRFIAEVGGGLAIWTPEGPGA